MRYELWFWLGVAVLFAVSVPFAIGAAYLAATMLPIP